MSTVLMRYNAKWSFQLVFCVFYFSQLENALNDCRTHRYTLGGCSYDTANQNVQRNRQILKSNDTISMQNFLLLTKWPVQGMCE